MPTAIVSIIAFIFGFVGSMPLAGPASVMIVSRGARKLYRDAFLLALGASLAEGIYAGLAFWGFSTFLARHPAVLPVSHAVTAVVLLIVGVHFLRWKEESKTNGDERRGSAFVIGFSISALNPALLATWSAATTAIYSRQIVRMTGLMAIPFGVAAAAGIVAWNALLVQLMKRFEDKFPKRWIGWVIRGMGLVLIAIAIWSAVDLVRHLRGHGPLGANRERAAASRWSDPAGGFATRNGRS